MSESAYESLLRDNFTAVRSDIASLHVVASHTAERVAVIEVEIAGLKARHSTAKRRWSIVTGLVAIGAGLLKLLPEGLHGK